jgi:hypothetical protein
MLSKALLLLAAAAASPQQFDLVCTGAGADTKGGAFEAKDEHLRVDLQAMKWCEDPPAGYVGDIVPCAVLHPIAEVQPGMIWFEKENDDEKVRGRMHNLSVDRQTGEYMYLYDMPILDRISRIAVVSLCEPAPFSGFPELKTKF